MANVQDRVIEVTARVLQLDAADIRPENNFTTDLGAESVQSIELVAMFEEEFGIDIPDEDAEQMRTVGDAIKYLHKHTPD